MILASFPSPDRSVWDLGPIPIRAYALCIIVGIIAAIWIGERRWVARGGRQGTVSDVAVWAVIFGLVGGRLYHVITDNELYFRAGRDPWRAFYVWEGGLGIWGAIALGGVGAWIACRRRGIKLPPFADAVAPGIAVAQGLGRWGNYFNQELFGKPTDLPWAVQIDPDRPSTIAGVTTYQPTFLYESIWDLALAAILIYVDKRFKLGRGRVFALYVMGYTAGRVWIELLRIDTANQVLGLRINVWTSIVVFIGGLVYFLLHRGPRETVVEPAGSTDPDAPAATGDAATAADEDADTTTAAVADEDDDIAATAADEDEDPADPKADKVTTAATTTAATTTAGTTAEDPADATTGKSTTVIAAADEPAAQAGDEPAAATAEEPAGPTAAKAEERTTAAAAAAEPAAAAAGEPVGSGATAAPAAELTAEERIAATETDEPLTVERRRRLLPAGRRKR